MSFFLLYCVYACRMRFQFGRYSNELIRFRFNLQAIQETTTGAVFTKLPLSVCCARIRLSKARIRVLFYLDGKIGMGYFNGPIACRTNKHNQFHLLFRAVDFISIFFAVSSISHFINIHISFFRSCVARFFFGYLFILLFTILWKCLLNRKFAQPKRKKETEIQCGPCEKSARMK